MSPSALLINPSPSVNTAAAAKPTLPTLHELGADLLQTTPWQRRWALARPFVLIALFAATWSLGWWWLAPLVVFLIFIAIVTVTHDVVHGSLGLTSRQTECWLFLLGTVLFESGHAYRATHHQHHRVFPGPNDPEGDPARMTLLQAILWGPLFLPKLWLWAYREQANDPRQRRWLLGEAAWALAFPLLAVAIWPWSAAPAAYWLLALVGSWVYPLLTVHLPHHGYGASPLQHSGTIRGVVIPRLFLELTYHLEHHLYPAVPSHHLAELSQRLEPTLVAGGVVPRWLP